MSFADRIDDPSLRELTTEELASKVEGLRYLLSLAPENKEKLVRRITQLEQREAELVGALEKVQDLVVTSYEAQGKGIYANTDPIWIHAEKALQGKGDCSDCGNTREIRYLDSMDNEAYRECDCIKGKGDLVAVPREPTEEMLDAAWELNFQHIERWMHDNMMEAKYKAMITAAQSNKDE